MLTPCPALAPSFLSVSLLEAAGEERLSGLFARLPESLRSDEATLRRVANLIRPVNEEGTRGSYAGWIARSAIREAAVQDRLPILESLLTFFQTGGLLSELPSSSRPLKRPPPDDPLQFSKGAEWQDSRFYLRGGMSGRSALGDGQATAYLYDPEVREISDRIDREAPELVDDANAQRLREEMLAKLSNSPAIDEHFGDALVAGALMALGDPLSREVAARIRDGAYRLFVDSDTKFETMVRERRKEERHVAYPDPSTQNTIYFTQGRGGGPTLYARNRPLNLPWNLGPNDVLRELLANIVHDDRHHIDLSKEPLSNQPAEEFRFGLELKGHGTEFLWRARHGDPGWLARFTAHSALGFAMAFRDYYEQFYGAGLV